MDAGDLDGLRVFIVDDDYAVAKTLGWLLSACGAEVLGMAASLDDATEAVAANPPQVAILDVNLKGQEVFPLAARLQEDGVPFVFLTGYGDERIPPELQAYPRLTKPVMEADLVAAILSLFSSTGD